MHNHFTAKSVILVLIFGVLFGSISQHAFADMGPPQVWSGTIEYKATSKMSEASDGTWVHAMQVGKMPTSHKKYKRSSVLSATFKVQRGSPDIAAHIEYSDNSNEDIVLKATVLCRTEVAKPFRAKLSGHIVNSSSTLGSGDITSRSPISKNTTTRLEVKIRVDYDTGEYSIHAISPNIAAKSTTNKFSIVHTGCGQDQPPSQESRSSNIITPESGGMATGRLNPSQPNSLVGSAKILSGPTYNETLTWNLTVSA